jgi:hypothetical protein
MNPMVENRPLIDHLFCTGFIFIKKREVIPLKHIVIFIPQLL